MAKQGVRSHKVLSSGRLTGPTKLTAAKKRAAVRKVFTTSVDSGYSLCSTDSEDQVASIHKGLDRCAALLQDILTKDVKDTITICPNLGRTVPAKICSTSTAGTGSALKKRVQRKNAPAMRIHKETDRKPNLGLSASQKDSSNAVQKQTLQTIQVPFCQRSPVVHPVLCEHVQTQMSLLDAQPLQANYNGILDLGSQSAAPFNYRLATSTPTLNSQNSENPLMIQPCVPQGGGVASVPVASSVSTVSQAPGIPTTSAVMSFIPVAIPNNPAMPFFFQPTYGTEAVIKQGKPGDKTTGGRSTTAYSGMSNLPTASDSESQMIDQNKYQHHNLVKHENLDSAKERSALEQIEGTFSEEENLNFVDIPVRDISCQTSFENKVLKPQKTTPEKTFKKVKTLKYLLEEIRRLVSPTGDREILRLISELEECVSLLPMVVESANIQAEVALAMQPLRSENVQLRRRLRILNQQLRERERAEKESRSDAYNFEMVSLQSLNMTLQSQLNESQKSLELLQSKNEELLKVINEQKVENKKLVNVIQEKEQELLHNKQQSDIDATKVKIEVEEVMRKLKNLQFKVESSEKENQIMGITLRQRDAEVNRLRKLTRTLQGSMAKLLSDLTVDTFHSKHGKCLTKSLLNVYEKQLQDDQSPVSTSVMNYLEKLENDQVLTSSEPVFSNGCGNMEGPEQNYENVSVPDIAYENFPIPKESLGASKNVTDLPGQQSPLILHTRSKQNAATNSDFGTVKGDEHRLDETTCIPLLSSPSKKYSAVSEKKMCTSPQSSTVSRLLEYDTGVSDSQKNNGFRNFFQALGQSEDEEKILDDKYTGNTGSNKIVANSSEMMERTKLEDDWLPIKSKEINIFPTDFSSKVESSVSANGFFSFLPHDQAKTVQPTNRLSIDSSVLSASDFISGKSDWSLSSFSTFTSHDEQDFRNGLAVLDANIARLQRTLQTGFLNK
uniref:LOW QUALITY PROTEIN: coiled-coil domain-containing protein 14 n=1 Tax=Geotrypetes seraphini TaxID=260995 RepID=A0A6P8REL8_GEOSA|nr:LOW QUALITY PROTEIN: coiled-coil domain-containing protein 14 [Geotrypetes seraphini]